MRSVLSTLYCKAQAYEAGEQVEFDGRKYPPLYTPRNSTLMELFDITDEEGKRLKTIITKEEAAERDAERQRQRRRKSGSSDWASHLEAIKETAEQRRIEARLLRARGLSVREIAVVMRISKSQVHRYLA